MRIIIGNSEAQSTFVGTVDLGLQSIAGILSHKKSPLNPNIEISEVVPGSVLPFVSRNAGAVLPASSEVLSRYIPGYKEPSEARVAELVEYAQRAENYGTMPGQAAALVEAIAMGLKPGSVFVFGTARGRIESLVASASEESEIVTLDIPQELVSPETVDSNNIRYREKIGVSSNESIGDIFRSDPSLSKRIHQILEDSMAFDATALSNLMRMVVIDCNHTIENVLTDLRNAFIMADKDAGSVIVLDDFRKTSPLNSGVEAAAVIASRLTDLPILQPSPKPGEPGFGADAAIFIVPSGFNFDRLIHRFDQAIDLLVG